MPIKSESRKRKVKREDVAQAAGVSSATVSYVLNGTKRLSPEVEKRVLEAARQLNYCPDFHARALAGSKSYTLGLLTTDIANTYQLEVIKGLQSEALKYDYVVIVFDAFGDTERYIDSLISRRVDGIFVSIAPDSLPDESLCKLRDADIRVLAEFARNSFLPDVSYVMYDHSDGLVQAVRYLKELGHSKIGFLSAFDEGYLYDKRLPDFHRAMEEVIGEKDPAIVYGSSPYFTSEEFGGTLMQRMMEEHPEVTAVIATNDLMAIGAIKAIKKAGKRVPEDYSVCGIDNIQLSRLCDPPLTTLDQNGREYGMKIFHILYDSISAHKAGEYILPMQLLVRGSTGPVRGA